MATTHEDTPGNASRSRSGFARSFRRKGSSRAGSETSSAGKERRSSLSVERPFLLRRGSTGSSTRRTLSALGGGKRNKASDSGSEALSRTTTDDGRGVHEWNDHSDSEAAGGRQSSNFTHTRPPLTPHHTDAGLLTLSSSFTENDSVDSLVPARSAPSLTPPRSAPSPWRSQPTLHVSPASSLRLDALKAPESTTRRSPSPAGRLRNAFRPSRKSSPASQRAAFEQNNARPTSSGSAPAGGGGAGGGVGGGAEGGGGGRGRTGTALSNGSNAPVYITDRALSQEPRPRTPSPTKKPAIRLLTADHPSTPPGANGPRTVLTPPTPTDLTIDRESTPPISSPTTRSPGGAENASSTNSPGPSHRKNKFSVGLPSKLSTSTLPPTTPGSEEEASTISQPINAGGFFLSIFSATQNAATSLSSSLLGVQRSKSGTGPDSQRGGSGEEEVILPPGSAQKSKLAAEEHKPLAIETLGSGNLSLSHLGIAETHDRASPMNSDAELVSGIRRDEMAARAEDDAAARAVSMAYSERARNGDQAPSLPASVVDTTEQSPPRPATEVDSNSVKRANSVRSRLSNKRRGTRGSSATTAVAMAPIISRPGSVGQKLTGFAVANSRRNRDFHSQFKSVPEDDFLIEDYSAALQRDILLHGRIYISEGHICFSSNILGWVTNLVISFDEIISVEKKATALVFQNGIIVQTLQSRNVFASLLARDTTYDLIISIWKITHPNLRSTANGVPIDVIGGGDKTEKIGSVVGDHSESEEIYDEEEEEDDDEDHDDDDEGSIDEDLAGSQIGSDVVDTKSVIRKVSTPFGAPPTVNGQPKAGTDSPEIATMGTQANQDFPGPQSHAPTDCGDASSHFERILIEDTIPAPLGKIYTLLFGPASVKFMRKWLLDDQKSLDLQLEETAILDEDHKSMSFSYIKPLNASIGPKQTKCMISATLEQFDLNKSVVVCCSTQNPDVPSGNIFVVKTKYCLSWAPGNSTKYYTTCQIEWSGKSWLKGPIEKGANEGQLQYHKDLVAALKAAVSSKSGSKGAAGKTRGKAKRKNTSENVTEAAVSHQSMKAKMAEPNWGLFEPLRGPLGPVADLVHPSVVVAFLLFMTMFLWWRLSAAKGGLGGVGSSTAARTAAYETLWKQEESELWKWLQDRAGIEGGVPGFLKGDDAEKQRWRGKQMVKAMEAKLDHDMESRQMNEAIRITKERLLALEEAVRSRASKT